MPAPRNIAFNGKGGAEILNLRIVGGIAQFLHSCPVFASWLDFWTGCDSSEELLHIYFGLLILKKKLKLK